MACPHVSGAAALLLQSNPSLRKNQILKLLKNNAANHFIDDLKVGDPNYFLWVGAQSAPAPPPTEGPKACPSFAVSEMPDAEGDCRCPHPQYCSRDGGASKR